MWFKCDIIVLISFLILFVSISFLVNIGKEMSLPGFRMYPLYIFKVDKDISLIFATLKTIIGRYSGTPEGTFPFRYLSERN